MKHIYYLYYLFICFFHFFLIGDFGEIFLLLLSFWARNGCGVAYAYGGDCTTVGSALLRSYIIYFKFSPYGIGLILSISLSGISTYALMISNLLA